MSAPASTLSLDPLVVFLRQRRWDRNWDCATVVLMTGGAFSTATLERWENGRTVPNVHQCRVWAAAFGLVLPDPVRAGTVAA